jgi:LysR family glycine cleavage system transcriptional activator
MRKLPFLNGVRAFEAAARQEGFARAADELHVTPAAISRMVQLLEQRLGVPLFERKANRLTLTAAGRAYQAGLTPILDQLALITAQVAAMAGSRVLTIGVGPTFATRWLIPRLADLQKSAPDVEVRFATGGATVPYNDEWTCGIRLGDGNWPGFLAERLFDAELRPVCAPALAQRLTTGRAGSSRSIPARSAPAARSSSTTGRHCRPLPTVSASPWASGRTWTTISRPAA